MKFIKEIGIIDWMRMLAITALVSILTFFLVLSLLPKQKCTDGQLRQILEKVELQKKKNAGTYAPDYGARLISELCE